MSRTNTTRSFLPGFPRSLGSLLTAPSPILPQATRRNLETCEEQGEQGEYGSALGKGSTDANATAISRASEREITAVRNMAKGQGRADLIIAAAAAGSLRFRALFSRFQGVFSSSSREHVVRDRVRPVRKQVLEKKSFARFIAVVRASELDWK